MPLTRRPEDAHREARHTETEPITIAHLSDLHFVTGRVGRFCRRILRWFHLADHNQDAIDALTTTLRPERPDLIVVSGDLTTLGDKASVRAASRFIEELATSCQVHSQDRTIII